jgi:hypothetical protein
MSLLDDFEKVSDITAEEILTRLMKADDIELKTEIKKPLHLAKLYVLKELMQDAGFNTAGEIIDRFIQKYLVYMVSDKRKGRREIIEAVSGIREQIKTVKEKLINPIQ